MMNDKFKIVTLPHVANVPNALREIADEIERGDYGEVIEGALVLNGADLETFSFGRADGTIAHYLFCCAAHKIQLGLLERD